MSDFNPEGGVDCSGGDGGLHCEAGAEAVRGRGDTLLEEWPKRESITSTSSFDSGGDDDDDDVASSINKSVHFSEVSQLLVYRRESTYLLQSLTYTQEDYNEFGKDALLEGLRIKKLIALAPPDSGDESIKYLLSHDIINREDFLGIEHFIFWSPTTIFKIRKRHAAAVLQKQQKQQHQKLEDPVSNLAKFAQSSSRRSTQRAKIRAGMAA